MSYPLMNSFKQWKRQWLSWQIKTQSYQTIILNTIKHSSDECDGEENSIEDESSDDDRSLKWNTW